MMLPVLVNSQQVCFENKQYPRPALSESSNILYQSKLAEAKLAYEKDTNNAEALIWYGRRTAYMGNYEEAISILQKEFVCTPQMHVFTAIAATDT